MSITGNVHIEYRRGHSTCGAVPVMPCCASCRSLSPENAIYLAGTGRAGYECDRYPRFGIGIVKKNPDSFRFRFRFLPTYVEGRIIAFRFKSVSDATLF